MVEPLSNPLPPAPPQIVRRKRTVLIATAIAVIIFILIVVSGIAIWLLRGTASEPTTLPAGGVLPNAEEQTNLPAISSPMAPGSTPSPLPGQIPLSLRVPAFQNNLGVAITFKREPSFALALATVSRTIENPTPERAQPLAGTPYSTLRVKNAAGDIIHERQVSISTQVELLVQGVELPNPIHQLPESTTYLVIPITAQNQPAVVEIVGTDGRVFDSRTFNFLELPVQAPTNATILSYASSESNQLTSAAGHIAGLGSWLKSRVAYAQESSLAPSALPSPSDVPPTVSPSPTVPVVATPPKTTCSANCFTIAVVAATDGALQAAVQQTERMVAEIEPWVTYASQVNVVPVKVKTEEDLHCYTIEAPGDRTMPLCPDSAAAAATLNGVDWDAAVVVTAVNCNCGTVQDINTSSIAAVGAQTDYAIIGHELGHSVGRMVDEYYYKYKFASGPLGPNCFESQTSCQENVQQFPAASCQLGCRTVSSWRPATQLMHTWPSSQYGPLETCIMAEQIRKVVGGESRFGECFAPDTQLEPPPGPAREGDYFGGRR